jgi:hypothetical protein
VKANHAAAASSTLFRSSMSLNHEIMAVPDPTTSASVHGPTDDLLSEDMSAFWSSMIFVIFNLGSELVSIIRVQFILSDIQDFRLIGPIGSLTKAQR